MLLPLPSMFFMCFRQFDVFLSLYHVYHFILIVVPEDQPAFSWCVLMTLQRARRICKAMKKRYFSTNQKCGIELPHTVEWTLQIDKKTGTTF
jgi:hypothetical protein